MKLVGLMMVRNEGWALGMTLRAAMTWCDAIVLLNHGNDPETKKIVEDAAGHHVCDVLVIENAPCDGSWREMDLRQRMLDEGRRWMGGTHFAIIDGDEMLTANRLLHVRKAFEKLKPGQHVAMRMISPWRSIEVRRRDGYYGDGSSLSLGFADTPGAAWVRASDGYQFHQRLPHGIETTPADPLELVMPGGVFHFQYHTRRRLVTKSVWYKMLETVSHPGRKTPDALNEMYDWTIVSDEDAVLAPIPRGWVEPWGKIWEHYHPDREPWQFAEVVRMLRERGPAVFAGLAFHELASEVLPCGRFETSRGVCLG